MTGGEETASTPAQTQTIRVDPHLHTTASYDGYTAPVELLERAAAAGLDAVVVTDHDAVSGARTVARLAPEYDVVGIVGCEVSTADGHLLAIGVDSAPEPGRPLRETARRVRRNGGLSVVPHPFQRSRHGARARAIADVDGVEVYNAHALTGLRNTQAARFAAREGYPSFGGSDAHRPATVGRAATAVRLPASATVTAERVVTAMRDGRTAAVGRRSSPGRYLSKIVENATRKTRSLATPIRRS